MSKYVRYCLGDKLHPSLARQSQSSAILKVYGEPYGLLPLLVYSYSV